MAFQDKLDKFIDNVSELSKNNSIPKWFKPFVTSFQNFAMDVGGHISELEGRLAVQKTVCDRLEGERTKLQREIKLLQDELDDLQQYSRRTCLLIHGVQEKPAENVEAVVTDIVNKS